MRIACATTICNNSTSCPVATTCKSCVGPNPADCLDIIPLNYFEASSQLYTSKLYFHLHTLKIF